MMANVPGMLDTAVTFDGVTYTFTQETPFSEQAVITIPAHYFEDFLAAIQVAKNDSEQ